MLYLMTAADRKKKIFPPNVVFFVVTSQLDEVMEELAYVDFKNNKNLQLIYNYFFLNMIFSR